MTLDAITQFLNQLTELQPGAFCVVLLLVLNLILRRIPHVANWTIMPVSAVVGMVIFPIFLTTATTIKHGLARNICEGLIVGTMAALGYKAVVAFAESKWPWLHNLLNDLPDAPAVPVQPEVKPEPPKEP